MRIKIYFWSEECWVMSEKSTPKKRPTLSRAASASQTEKKGVCGDNEQRGERRKRKNGGGREEEEEKKKKKKRYKGTTRFEV